MRSFPSVSLRYEVLAAVTLEPQAIESIIFFGSYRPLRSSRMTSLFTSYRLLPTILMLQIANRLFVVDQLRDGRVGTANRAIVRLGRELDLAEFHRQSVVS